MDQCVIPFYGCLASHCTDRPARQWQDTGERLFRKDHPGHVALLPGPSVTPPSFILFLGSLSEDTFVRLLRLLSLSRLNASPMRPGCVRTRGRTPGPGAQRVLSLSRHLLGCLYPRDAPAWFSHGKCHPHGEGPHR